MEGSQTTIEHPDPKATDYENWLEYRNGISKNPDYDDGSWQLSYFIHYSQGQTEKLRKFLKFKPSEKKELSRKVRFNLFLMDLEDSLNLKAGFAMLIIIGFSFSADYFSAEYGFNFKIPLHIKITLVVCLLLGLFVKKLSEKLPISFYPYMFGKPSHLFADCSECEGTGISDSMTCRTCNGIGNLVYFGDPHYAYKDNGEPCLDERNQQTWNNSE